MTKIRIQFRFLLQLFVALAVLGVALFFLHRFQVSRQTDALLVRARAAAESEDYTKATRYYGQYVSERKQDSEVRLELAELYSKLGLPQRAYFYLEEVLRLDPNQIEARKALVEADMQLGRFSDAVTQLEDYLLKEEPENAELHWQLGICQQQQSENEAAIRSMKKALKLQPTEPKYAAVLAETLSKRSVDSTEARMVLDDLVNAAPQDAMAYVARGEWLMKQRSAFLDAPTAKRDELLEDAWADAQSAIGLAPDDGVVAGFMAQIAIPKKEYELARSALERAIQSNPKLPRLYSLLAEIEREQGNVDGAVATYQKGIQQNENDPDLRWNKAQLDFGRGDLAAVNAAIKEMRDRNYPAPMVRFLEGRVHVSEGKWQEAIKLLEEVRVQLQRDNNLVKQVDFLLATCYRNLGNSEQELAALRKCLNTDPMWMPARDALAVALMRAGKLQESLNEYAQIANAGAATPAALLNYARILFLQGLEEKRMGDGWNPLLDVLDRLDQDPAMEEDVGVLRAELLVNQGKLKEDQGKLEEAKALIQEAEALIQQRLEGHPKSMTLYQALVAIQSLSQDWEKVRMTLKDAGEALGDSPALRLERARLAWRRDGDEVDRQELDQLANPREEWGEGQRSELASGFATLYLTLRDYEKAGQYAEIAANSKTGETNISRNLILFDIAVLTDDSQRMEKALERIKAIEGTGPLWNVGEATRLTLEAGKFADKPLLADDKLTQALRCLAEAEKARPNWARVPRLRGEILDRQGNTEGAIEAYQEAIQAGEQSPQTISRAIALLFNRRRYVEADELIRKLQDQQVPFSTELTRTASEISARLENIDRALPLAEDLAAKSENMADHIWLAQLYSISRRSEDAEREFRVAVEKDPKASVAWVSLIQHYARTEQRVKAEEAIAEALVALDEENRDDALAQAYQSLKEYETADGYYQKILQKVPVDPAVARRYAEFCLQASQTTREEAWLLLAEPWLEKIASDELNASEQDRAWGRRALALIVGLRGREADVQRARSLIAANQPMTQEDQRVLASVLANLTDGAATQEAITILEAMVQSAPKFSLPDHFLLAQLYLRIKDWNRYGRTMRSVMGNGGAEDERYVRSYIAALTEQGETSEALLWLERAKKTWKENLVGNCSQETELLYQVGNYDKIEPLLTTLAQNAESKLAAADLAERFGRRLQGDGKQEPAKKFLGLAETWYGEVAASDPQQRLAQLGFYARNGDIPDVIKALEGKELPPKEFSEMMQSALQAPQLTVEGAKLLIPLIRAESEKHPEELLLKISLGDYCSWAGEVQQARVAYESVLKIKPKLIPALNNLAMVLSGSGKDVDAAMAAIEKAIELDGPKDYLLDTRGIVRMAAGNWRGAEEDFRKALNYRALGDRSFHLAQALQGQGRKEEAQEMLKKAQEAGVSAETLHPVERAGYQKLIGIQKSP